MDALLSMVASQSEDNRYAIIQFVMREKWERVADLSAHSFFSFFFFLVQDCMWMK